MCIFSFHACKNKPISWWSKSRVFFKMHIWWSCENLCFCPLKRKVTHGKLNKTEFGCRFCRICHLGRLSAIIIDVLYLQKGYLQAGWNWNMVGCGRKLPCQMVVACLTRQISATWTIFSAFAAQQEDKEGPGVHQGEDGLVPDIRRAGSLGAVLPGDHLYLSRHQWKIQWEPVLNISNGSQVWHSCNQKIKLL